MVLCQEGRAHLQQRRIVAVHLQAGPYCPGEWGTRGRFFGVCGCVGAQVCVWVAGCGGAWEAV